MNAIECPACHFQNREGVKFCTQCGNRLDEEILHGPRLVMLYGENKGVLFKLNQERTTIGRDIDNEIILRDEKISKQHAAIVKKNGFFWIEDLQSRNGVYVNGKAVEKMQKLFNGNLIKLGFTIFRFESDTL